MNKTINGKRYDTEKAKPVGEAGNGLYPGDLDYYCETLYHKRTGKAQSAILEELIGKL